MAIADAVEGMAGVVSDEFGPVFGMMGREGPYA
jgi:hypothetical protein